MLEKPSDADARALKTLFPSSSHLSKRSRTAGFSPLDECVYSKEKKQKKGVRIKPRKITVVLITDPDCKKVPRRDKRKALLDDGCIRQLEFTKSMSSQSVRQVITKGFSDKITGKADITILTADPKLHVLTKFEEQDRGATGADVYDIVGQGSLYVRTMVSFYL